MMDADASADEQNAEHDIALIYQESALGEDDVWIKFPVVAMEEKPCSALLDESIAKLESREIRCCRSATKN